jgi:hypothetical protein
MMWNLVFASFQNSLLAVFDTLWVNSTNNQSLVSSSRSVAYDLNSKLEEEEEESQEEEVEDEDKGSSELDKSGSELAT